VFQVRTPGIDWYFDSFWCKSAAEALLILSAADLRPNWGLKRWMRISVSLPDTGHVFAASEQISLHSVVGICAGNQWTAGICRRCPRRTRGQFYSGAPGEEATKQLTLQKFQPKYWCSESSDGEMLALAHGTGGAESYTVLCKLLQVCRIDWGWQSVRWGDRIWEEDSQQEWGFSRTRDLIWFTHRIEGCDISHIRR